MKDCPWQKVTALSGIMSGIYNGHLVPKPLPWTKWKPGRFVEEPTAQDLWGKIVQVEILDAELHRREVLEKQICHDIQAMQKILMNWAAAADDFMTWLQQWQMAFHGGGRFVHPNECRRMFLRALSKQGIGIDHYTEEDLL